MNCESLRSGVFNAGAERKSRGAGRAAAPSGCSILGSSTLSSTTLGSSILGLQHPGQQHPGQQHLGQQHSGSSTQGSSTPLPAHALLSSARETERRHWKPKCVNVAHL